ncbi:hypothetical protein IV203_016995 [Nitzschia inconspicua]|uniref:Uncharacterized protein n=1 Tax=Nitzschia inconspicua TaxID=303405 RepID=A0A9K3K6W6_9STRA|nr:hypothetical protein IV203_017493 [Nitzschia inconspicua]KAG7348290.1 hypothetical protein IV203_016995 [Nitzschia inconspicua]
MRCSIVSVVVIFFSHVLYVCHGFSTNNKKLVILAGPHQTAHENIRRWFDQYASDYDDSAASSRMGGGWKWPTLHQEDKSLLQDEDVSRPDIFRLLFTDESESWATRILHRTIRENWEIAESGIVLGHERFDKVGETPHSQMDALKVIYRIVEELSVRREDVTIVLVYRTPRLQQWIDIWDVQSDYDEYQDFICDENDEADKRREYAATAMNIGMLSKNFLQNGFNVVVIDEEGTKKSNLDLSHTLACNILQGVECDRKGRVVGLEYELTQFDESDDSQYQELSGLTLQQLHDLETLFLERDCVYQAEVESHERFRILNKNQLFSKCEIPNEIAAREKLMDPGYVDGLLQSQSGCENGAIPGQISFNPSRIGKTGRTAVGKFLLFFLFLILSLVGVALAFLLHRSLPKNHAEAELDGLFQKSSPRNCLFRKRHNSEGSTEGSSDEESPPSSLSRGMVDVSLEPDPPSTPSLNLCNACKLVRIDPKCPYCNGGKERPSGTSSFGAQTYSGDTKRKPYTDKISWHDDGNSMSWDNTTSAVVTIDDFNLGSQQAQVSLRKSKNAGRSLVFRKLKELARLKNERNEDGEIVLNPDNLQMDRDDESVVSFT